MEPLHPDMYVRGRRFQLSDSHICGVFVIAQMLISAEETEETS
jgi:hypothetical protein